MVVVYIEATDDLFWVVANDETHAKEILADDKTILDYKSIEYTIILSNEKLHSMKIGCTNDNPDQEETDFLEVLNNYHGMGEILCTTQWDC